MDCLTPQQATQDATQHGIAVCAMVLDGTANYALHDFTRATLNAAQVPSMIAQAADIHRIQRGTPGRIVPGLMLGTAGLIGIQVRADALDRFTEAFGDIDHAPVISQGWDGDESSVIIIYRRTSPLHDLNDAAMNQWGNDIELIYGEHRAMPTPGATWQHTSSDQSWQIASCDIATLHDAPNIPPALEALLTSCAPFTRTTLHDHSTRTTIDTLAHQDRDHIAALLDALCDPLGAYRLTHATLHSDGRITLGLPGASGPSSVLIIGKDSACELESWTDAHPKLRRGHRYGLIHGHITDMTAPANIAALSVKSTMQGASFVLDDQTSDDWWWGNGSDILAMRGEAVVLAANTGTGKTTLAGQVIAAWIGAQPDALGCQVRSDGRKVLLLAMDRPKQAARALRRIFTDEHRELLDQMLIVRKGPPPAQITSDPTVWATLAAEHDAGLIIIDGLKDATSELNGDEAGLAANQAMQSVIAAGCELLVLHHLRIGVAGGKPSLDDLYGSTWIPSGAGSVIVLQGLAGGDTVKLHHLKSPVDAVGPWDIALNTATGTMRRMNHDDLRAIVTSAGSHGIDAKQAAVVMYQDPDPSDEIVKRVKRILDKRAKQGDFIVRAGERGGRGGSAPTRYSIATSLDDYIETAKTHQP